MVQTEQILHSEAQQQVETERMNYPSYFFLRGEIYISDFIIFCRNHELRSVSDGCQCSQEALSHQDTE